MAKPKAPVWLREAFRDGVDDQTAHRLAAPEAHKLPYKGAWPTCWLAPHDPTRQPCSGPLERFHFIPRQRVENALGALMPDRWELLEHLEAQMGEPDFWSGNYAATIAKAHGELVGSSTLQPLAELVLIAAWDPRNGGLGCEHHHRRFDSHACSPRAPNIEVPAFNLPEHVDQFIGCYGLEQQAEDRFPGAQSPDRAYLWTPPR